MTQPTVDLRSDTLTLPTQAMRQAMLEAPLGDDCYGEDPTVERLQEMAAERLGMEAALYVPTGTMANTCALLSHANMGDEVIVDGTSHLYNYEAGALANIAGLVPRLVDSHDGVVDPDELAAVVRPANPHFAPARLVCIENTHNAAAGAAWSPAQLGALAATAHQHGLKVHVDGARIFNAAVAHGVEAAEYGTLVDSLTFCISKGLSGPVGSVLCGSRDFIERAYKMRKRLGGAMRQVGIIAAAGIVALEQMVDRLAEDHLQARRLADGLAAIDGIEVIRPPEPNTNIHMVDVGELGWTSADLIERWLACGIRCNPRPPSRVRVLTHRHISAEDIDYVVETTRRLVQER
ncbi:MAG: aminotransferase class I/II-fold pyridoxal phosphate-dependent enzyme [Candidatus Latescibacteria bacterium]|nr:aminotransferase class I/II-fold pyridoxal phosphate-dependent enzyme [Candidatus Latescibacterota bacterium]